MAISVNWATKVITVPKDDTEWISDGPPEIRKFDVNAFRLTLKALEDDEAGIWALDTHRHNTEVTLSGITFARTFEIINDYTVTFGDGQYVLNLYGANHNILDVANANQVSLRGNLSGGLLVSSVYPPTEDIVNALMEALLGAGEYGYRS